MASPARPRPAPGGDAGGGSGGGSPFRPAPAGGRGADAALEDFLEAERALGGGPGEGAPAEAPPGSSGQGAGLEGALRGAAGEGGEVAALTDLEIIFEPLGPREPVDLGGACPRLQRVSLIGNNLRRLPRLEACGPSLTRVCVINQALETMAGLGALPALKELVLSNNGLQRLEGLEGCRALEMLWLDRNRIEAIEGLDRASNLRRLHLQANPIASLAGLHGLVSLRALNLAGTRVASLRDLEALALVQSLEAVAFKDPHFEDAPITAVEGYRQLAIYGLKQIQELDGVPISGHERQETQDTYLKTMLEFNDEIDDVKRQGNEFKGELEQQRQATLRQSDALQQELVAKLQQLEALVQQGRSKVLDAYERRALEREAARDGLVKQIAALQEQHAELIAREVRAREAQMERLQLAFRVAESRKGFQQQEAERLMELPNLSEGLRAAYEVKADSPEMAFVQRDFDSSIQRRGSALSPGLLQRSAGTYSLVAVYRLCDTAAAAHFQRLLEAVATKTKQGGAEQGKVKLQWLYLGLPLDELHEGLRGGFGEAEHVFARDPISAYYLALGEAREVNSHVPVALLLCQVLQERSGEASGAGVKFNAADGDAFLPQFYLQVQSRPGDDEADGAGRAFAAEELQQQIVRLLSEPDVSSELDAQLQEIEHNIEGLLAKYQQSMWTGLDQTMTATIQRQDEDIVNMKKQLHLLNSEIAKQQAAQDVIVRNFRGHNEALEGFAPRPSASQGLGGAFLY